MKKTLCVLTALAAATSISLADDLDPRFEGMWVGMETYSINTSATQQAHPPIRQEATIVVDPKGRMFGVLQGLGRGKYEATKNSSGTKLSFKSHLTGSGRNQLTLTLSPDGNTITETGFGTYPCKPYACTCDITGTLHRKGK